MVADVFLFSRRPIWDARGKFCEFSLFLICFLVFAKTMEEEEIMTFCGVSYMKTDVLVWWLGVGLVFLPEVSCGARGWVCGELRGGMRVSAGGGGVTMSVRPSRKIREQNQ